MNVSVVIRCHNEERYIGRLLEGIRHQTIGDTEIIVVDSGSTDGTLRIVSDYPVRVVSIQPEAFSFGRSLNAGCRTARGDVIAIVSAHCYPLYNDWLERLTQHFDDENVALVYGKQRGNEVTTYSEHQVFHKWFPDQSDLDQKHPFCNNANAAIRRCVWEELPYNEELTGLEDLDWARRALARDHGLVYDADAEIVHVHEETWRQVYNRYRREAIALHRIFPHEHFSLWDLWRLLGGNVINDYHHAWHDHVLWKHLLTIPAFRLMQLGGTYRGFRLRGPVTSRLKQTFYYPNGRRRTESGRRAVLPRQRIPYANSAQHVE
jgi:rhamnosyltransferase